MKTGIQQENSKLFEKLIAQLQGESKEYRISFVICISSFLLASAIDIILSIRNSLFLEAALMGFSVLWNISFSIFIYFNRNRYYLVPLLFFILVATISVMVFQNGFSTGCYFYFFPATIVYIINSINIRHKVKFYSILFNTVIFIAWVSFIFLISSNSGRQALFNNLFIYRLTISIILSAFLIRHLLITFTYKKEYKGKKNYYEAFFQSNLDGYIVFDKETKIIIDFNRNAALMLELPFEVSLNGLYISQLMMRYLTGNSVNMDILMDDMPDNWHGEGNFRTHNKREFNAYINNVTYVKDEKEYQILCIRDISGLKKTENELILYKEKLEHSAKAKARFLSGMSHELRTPLNGIIGTANLILSEQNLSENIKKQLNLQLYSSEHMLSIINDILDFSKIESGKMELNKESFNLIEAVQFLINTFESQFKNKTIDLIFNYDPEIKDLYIKSDVVKLRQILYNLISNALKFTFEGKVVLTVLIENSDSNDISLTFKVEDTGIGIKKEKQFEIFEGFVQVHSEDLKRRFGGTGLGLTISEKLANLLGGEIKVESELGKGACFYFTLTFNKDIKEQLQAEETELYKPQNDIRGVRILVVEDNEINSAILNKFLQNWGIRIKEAGNGLQALELMKYHQFDLILMDLEMPEMNGYAAVKIIRETNTEVPIIAFTATLLENMDSLITNDGFNDYVLKPFRPAELKKKIEKFVPHRKFEYA